MKTVVSSQSVPGLPFDKVEYALFSPDGICREQFIQKAAIFFIQSWMSACIPEILDIWSNWDKSSEEERQYFLSHLDHLLSEGVLIDEPDAKHFSDNSHHTVPIGTFSETMLRWVRKNFDPAQLLVEPVASMPTNDGKIDLVEITGFPGNYESMRVTLWEVKSSDGQVGYHNSKIYRQIEDYPKRFFSLANCLASSYSGNDIALKTFLKNMGRMARNRLPQVHYGVFISYDLSVRQTTQPVPNLHNHPRNHPSENIGENCHHLALLLLPDFRQLRLEVWRLLHLV